MPRFVAAVTALLTAVFAASAAPVDEVFALVPPNTAVCFVVQDLRGQSEKLLASPFADWFPKSAFGKAVLITAEAEKVRAGMTAIAAQLGVTPEELRDDVFGDAVVFAYQPTRGMGEDSGVILAKARKPDTLAKFVRSLNAEQTKAGDLKEVREKSHRGLAYFEREEAKGKKEYYRTRPDGVLMFSGQESAVQAVIEVEVAGKPAGTPRFVALRERLGVPSAVGQLIFDPRALDGELAAKTAGTDKPQEKAFLTQFGKVWAATDAVGVSLSVDRGAELALTLAVDAVKLPKDLTALFAPAAGSTALWSVIPRDALLAAAGRFSLPKSIDLIAAFLGEEGRTGMQQTLNGGVAPVVGKDVLPKLITGLGPDWGLWVTAPAKATAPPLPTAVFALRVRAAGATDDSPGESIVSGLDTGAHLLRLEYNKSHDDQFTLAEAKSEAGRVKYLKNDTALPAGVQPAYGLRGDFLVIASHPDAVAGFTPPNATSKVDSAPLVRVSCKAAAAYLRDRGKELSGLIAGWAKAEPAAVEKELTEWLAVLELFDTLELRHTGDGKRTTLSIHAEMAKPLKK
jgi:hypothetical protein